MAIVLLPANRLGLSPLLVSPRDGVVDEVGSYLSRSIVHERVVMLLGFGVWVNYYYEVSLRNTEAAWRYALFN